MGSKTDSPWLYVCGSRIANVISSDEEPVHKLFLDNSMDIYGVTNAFTRSALTMASALHRKQFRPPRQHTE
jgi:hypothetical protein